MTTTASLVKHFDIAIEPSKLTDKDRARMRDLTYYDDAIKAMLRGEKPDLVKAKRPTIK